MAVLHGNLAPRGAVIKHSAASPKLLQHTGRAVVFDSVEDMTLRVDDPAQTVLEGEPERQTIVALDLPGRLETGAEHPADAS